MRERDLCGFMMRIGWLWERLCIERGWREKQGLFCTLACIYHDGILAFAALAFWGLGVNYQAHTLGWDMGCFFLCRTHTIGD